MDEKTTQMTAEPRKTEETPAKKPIPTLKKPKKRRLRRILAVLVLLAAAGGAAAWFFRGDDQPQISSNYQPVQVVRRDLAVSVSGTATLEPADSYSVTALVSGEIKSAPFEELSHVAAGDLLYDIDASSVQNSINSAALSLEEAQLSYQRALEAGKPKASISGTVSQVYVKNGDMVAAGDPLVKIVASTDVAGTFYFTYTDPSSFYIGQSATVFIDGYAGSVQGTVEAVSDSTTLTADGKEACTVRVRITNPGTLTEAKSCTAQAVVGSNSSYGSVPLSMGDAATVTADVSGTVSGLSKLAGSTVTKGEQVCTLDSEAIRQQAENARLAVQSARLGENQARDSMEGYRITSPISGTVIQKNFKAGDKVDGVTSGTLAVVYDMSMLKMEMNVDELNIGSIQVGQVVEITAAALAGKTFTGTVDKVSIAGTTTNGFTSYPVTIVLKDYGDLRPGMNVSCSIICSTTTDALCVPVDAVSRGNTVLVPGEGAMTEDGAVADESRLEERTVTLGASDAEYIQILSGLEEGDTVLLQTQSDEMGG